MSEILLALLQGKIQDKVSLMRVRRKTKKKGMLKEGQEGNEQIKTARKKFNDRKYSSQRYRQKEKKR